MKVLLVCTHNRTRSVLMEALLGCHLHERGVDARTASVGTVGEAMPPMPEVVDLLAAHGVDVADHLSQSIDASVVAAADLVLTAEVQHVVHVAGSWRGTFARTFTLPEFVRRADAVGPRSGAPMPEWLQAVGEGRPTGVDYLHDESIGEVDDPTGGPPEVWSRSFAEIDEWCRRVAELLA